MFECYARPIPMQMWTATHNLVGPATEENDDKACGHQIDGWFCTRYAGHDGDHMAGTSWTRGQMTQIVARWDNYRGTDI